MWVLISLSFFFFLFFVDPQIAHAQKIRQIVLSNFDLATMAMREEEKKRLLHFVIVGGGPTGVEFSAELSDFLTQDLSKKFPKLCKVYIYIIFNLKKKKIRNDIQGCQK